MTSGGVGGLEVVVLAIDDGVLDAVTSEDVIEVDEDDERVGGDVLVGDGGHRVADFGVGGLLRGVVVVVVVSVVTWSLAS